VVAFNGRPVHEEHELPEMVAETAVGSKVPLEILRNGKKMTLEVKIGELKEQQVASAKSEEGGGNWGMAVRDITPDIAQQLHLQRDKGVVIQRIAPDSPAADAGLQPGDIVLEVNRKKVGDVKQFLAQAEDAKRTKKPALLLVQRGNSTLYTVVNPKG
jgi:serine protease Do